jgi:putative glutamine amidotransferase
MAPATNTSSQRSKVPVLLPALGDRVAPEDLLAHLDGVLLTGGASNVEPHHYDGPPPRDDKLRDPLRDGLTLGLIHAAIARGMPVFGICRGIQEINVALGGSLHPHLHEVPGREDHRRNRELPFEESMATRHTLKLTPGGALAQIAAAEEVRVNSLHAQGIDRLAEALRIEALAEDGTIEAVSMPTAPGFLLGVQWHAEWQPDAHPLHQALFEAFGAAVRDYAAGRRANGHPTASAQALAAD